MLNFRFRELTFASVCGAIGAISPMLFPGVWIAGSHSFAGLPIASFSGLSAALMGLLSALLWARAAHDQNGEFGNALAAGFTGAAAAFGIGGIPVTPEMVATHPTITAHLPEIGYTVGWGIALSIFVTAVFRRG